MYKVITKERRLSSWNKPLIRLEMNGLDVLQNNFISFLENMEKSQDEIIKIEAKRNELASKRNEIKKCVSQNPKVKELGKEISQLGNKSQELQNILDFNVREFKGEMYQLIDSLVAEGIRKIRKFEDQIEEINQKIDNYAEKELKYAVQKNEFYIRFGRIPELSEKAMQEIDERKKTCTGLEEKIQGFQMKIETERMQLKNLAEYRGKVKSGNIDVNEYYTKGIEGELIGEFEAPDLLINGQYVEKIEDSKELDMQGISILFDEPKVETNSVMAFEKVPQKVEQSNFAIGELELPEFEKTDMLQEKAFAQDSMELPGVLEEKVEDFSTDGEKNVDNFIKENVNVTDNFFEDKRIEEIAKNIVEQISTEQTQDIIYENIENEAPKVEEKKNPMIPLFAKIVNIQNIIIKVEEGKLIYKAQMSDNKIVQIVPQDMGEKSVLLRDKQNRDECESILINYSLGEYKSFDKGVIKKIDPLVCELLIECAEKYNLKAEELMYEYVMGFSNKYFGNEENSCPEIIYNLSYLNETSLTRKEKNVLFKIARYARKTGTIEVIGDCSKIGKIKYAIKRLFAINNVKVLPEAKYNN